MLTSKHIHQHKLDNDYPLLLLDNTITKNDSRLSLIHCHNEIQIIHVLSGNLVIYSLSSTHYCSKGDIIFINTNVFHKIVSHNSHYRSLLFNDSLIKILNNDNHYYKIIGDLYYDIFIYHDDISINSINLIYNNEDNYFKTIQLLTLWYQLTNLIIKKDTNNTISNNTDITQLLSYINENYKNQITLHDLSIYSYLSSSTIQRLFKKFTSLSPYDYIIHYRLEKSVNLLVDTTMSISKIADNIGYTSTSLYISHFKKYYKYTPLQYRQIHK